MLLGWARNTPTKPMKILRTSSDRKDLITTIVKTYYTPDNGMIAWNRAFEEHPDWRTQLNFGDDATGRVANRCYAQARWIKLGLVKTGELPPAGRNASPAIKRQLARLHIKRGRGSNNSHPAEESGPQETPPKTPSTPALSPIQYCPQCGLNLRMFTAAFTVAMRHSNNV